MSFRKSPCVFPKISQYDALTSGQSKLNFFSAGQTGLSLNDICIDDVLEPIESFVHGERKSYGPSRGLQYWRNSSDWRIASTRFFLIGSSNICNISLAKRSPAFAYWRSHQCIAWVSLDLQLFCLHTLCACGSWRNFDTTWQLLLISRLISLTISPPAWVASNLAHCSSVSFVLPGMAQCRKTWRSWWMRLDAFVTALETETKT